jgi:STE24 endopeptidase
MSFQALLFKEIFLVTLLGVTLLRLWLALRQIRAVKQNRHQVPQAFASQIDLAAHQKSADYTIAKTRLGIAGLGVELGLILIITQAGYFEWADQWVRQLGAASWLQPLLLAALIMGLGSLLELPLSLVGQFGVEARFGFNRMTLELFLKDMLRSLLLTLLLGAPLFLALLWIVNSLGATWWLWAWGFWMGVNLILMVLYPTVLAPLFNKFTPLPQGELYQRIEVLMQRCGFRATGLFVMDGSKRSSHGNAYFTGLGAAKRVVFFDTLLERLNFDETEAVLAHELGHYRCHHVQKRMALLFAGSLGFFALLGLALNAPWFYQGLGVSTPSAAAALLLFMLIVPVFSFPLKPLLSLSSRKHEFEADAYACGQVSPNHLVTALVKLYRDNASTLTPDPIYSAVYDSHPPASIRIAHILKPAS